MDETKRYFDKEAATWDENPVRVKLAEDVGDAMLAQVPLNRALRVLDFGCGTGLVTLRLAPLVGTITGADSSQGMLDVLETKSAKSALGNVQTQWLGPDGDGALGGPYDLIVSSMVLHHIEDLAPLLARFRQCLVPGGRLCVADLDLEGGRFHEDNTGVFHLGFDRGALCKIFIEAGFEKVDAVTVATVMKPDKEGQVHPFDIFLISGQRA